MTDGEKLKKRLLEIGMTKSEFARRYGASSQNTYVLFRSKEISRENKKKIEKILDFKFEPEPENEYKVKYFKLQKKYISILEENKKLTEENKKLKLLLFENEI